MSKMVDFVDKNLVINTVHKCDKCDGEGYILSSPINEGFSKIDKQTFHKMKKLLDKAGYNLFKMPNIFPDDVDGFTHYEISKMKPKAKIVPSKAVKPIVKLEERPIVKLEEKK